ncbi:Ig-like domain-containing protein, partial [Comamonas thiooxydans]|uniref:Ig-like domain-containing protein n=1 Tax=Comamonas thiooxydans TaxID=363952 RepID=UPI00103D9C43
MVSSVVLSNHSDVPVDNEATNITAPASPANFLLASVHREDVANYSHVSNDLIIQFKNGRTLQIKGFFTTHEIANNLVFEEDNQLILVEFHNAMSGAGDGIVEASVIYEPIEDGLATTALLGLLGAAAIGLAAGGGGGGGSPSTPPAPPSLTISGNGKPVADGHATNDNTPNLSGTAKPGSTVTIYDNGQAIGSTTADGNGNWSYTPTQPLTEGSHSLTATATDSTGSSSPSPAQTVGVDTQPPSAPNIGTVTDNAGTATGSIVAGGTTDDATPTLSGTAEPGSTVSIYDGSTLLGTTTAGPDGIWTFTPSPPLTDGSHQLTATATDAAGNPSGPSASFGLTVDTTPPAAPVATISDPNGDNIPTASGTTEPGSTVTVTWPDGSTSTTTADPVTGQWTVDAPTVQPSGTVSAVATDPAGNTSPMGSTAWTADTTVAAPVPTVTDPNGDNIPTVSGTTDPGATVTITWPDGTTSTTTADPVTGQWTVDAPAVQHSGTVSAVATDPAGNTSSGTGTWTADITPPDTTAAGTTVTVTSVAGDNVVNATESTATSVPVTVSLANVPADATTTTVNVLVDGVTYAATSADGGITWTAQVPGSALAGA